MKKFFQIIVLSMLLVSFHASPSFAGDHENGNNEHRDHDKDKGKDKDGSNRVPINGGIAILLAAGVVFGVKKLIDRNNSNKEKNSLI